MNYLFQNSLETTCDLKLMYSLLSLFGCWGPFGHVCKKKVVLSSSVNAVSSALNDSFESEEGECYVACVAGGFYRPGERAMEGIGACHFSRLSLLAASSLSNQHAIHSELTIIVNS